MAVTDEALAAAFRETRDARAFEELVVRYLGTLRRFLAVGLPADPEGAADAEQEVLIRLYAALPKWRGESQFSTFLFTLARRVCADEVRRRVRERRNLDRLARRSQPQQELDEAAANPGTAWETVEEGRRLRRALATLEEPDRSLLYLKDAEGFEISDLAQVFGLKEGTIKSKLSRARTQLRTVLQEERYA